MTTLNKACKRHYYFEQSVLFVKIGQKVPLLELTNVLKKALNTKETVLVEEIDTAEM